MREFDEYISSIIGDLKIHENKKYEMAEELRDHLQMLKIEYVSKGYSESEAVIKAIESFGQEKELKKVFSDSVLNFQNKTTVFTGIVLTLLIYIIGSHIPVSNVNLMFYNTSPIISLILFFLFVPLGYFIPVIFPRISKTSFIIIATLPLGIITGICFNLITEASLHIVFIIGCTFCGVLGSIIGYKALISFNRILLYFTESIPKRS